MKHFVQKNLDTIIRTAVYVGITLAIAGGYYAYYVNQLKP